MAVVVKTNGTIGIPFWYHFGVGEFTAHFRTYVSEDWDVHCRYNLDFDGHMEPKTSFQEELRWRPQTLVPCCFAQEFSSTRGPCATR